MASHSVMDEKYTKEKELFIRFGSAASEAMFDFAYHTFQIPECEGIIAYRIEYHCALIFGGPMCPPHETIPLLEAFHNYCEKLNLNIIYIIVSKEFTKQAEGFYSISFEVCDELIFDLKSDPCATSNRLRHRVEKAAKHGLTVHEYLAFDANIESTINELGIQWQRSIKGPNVYLGHLNFFDDPIGKRWFYVKDGEEITAMLMLSKIEAHQRWLLKFLIISPHAFHDTSEFLVTTVFKILEEENCSYLTKGMVPSDSLGEIKGLGHLSTSFSKMLYSFISKIFRFKKRKEYWLRYHPHIEPAYVLLSRPRFGLNEMRALMKVFRTNYT